MNKLVVRQGDQLPYAFPITFRNGLIQEEDIDEIEFSVGSFLIKTYTDGDINYDDTSNYFEVRLSQEDTFSLLPSKSARGKYFEYPTQIRVKLRDCMGDGRNYIYSFPGPNVEVLESLSKERI